jgi:hypothetical protein
MVTKIMNLTQCSEHQTSHQTRLWFNGQTQRHTHKENAYYQFFILLFYIIKI